MDQEGHGGTPSETVPAPTAEKVAAPTAEAVVSPPAEPIVPPTAEPVAQTVPLTPWDGRLKFDYPIRDDEKYVFSKVRRQVSDCPFASDNTDAKERQVICRYQSTGRIELGTTVLHTGATQSSSEHDGMYEVADDVVIIWPGATRSMVHTLRQWEEKVSDCRTTFTMQRWARPLGAKDDEPTLCIETTEVAGEGLFLVMTLEDAGIPWLPIARTRSVEAYRLDGATRELDPMPDLDSRCPDGGYRPFVDVPLRGDGIDRFKNDPGVGTALAQCPLIRSRTCFSIDACEGAGMGVHSVLSSATPPVVPWGPVATVPKKKKDADSDIEEKVVAVRARINLLGDLENPSPSLEPGTPIVLQYAVAGAEGSVMRRLRRRTARHQLHIYSAKGVRALTVRVKPKWSNAKDAVFPFEGTDAKKRRWSTFAAKLELGERAQSLAPGQYLVQVEHKGAFRLLSNVLPLHLGTKAAESMKASKEP